MNRVFHARSAAPIFIAMLAFTTETSSVAADYQTDATQKTLKIFDATLYKNKPDLSEYGIVRLPIIYGHLFWEDRKAKESLPKETNVKKLIMKESKTNEILCIDIEHWPLKGDSAVVQESLKKYKRIIEWAKETNPNIKYGYYGQPPIADYWRTIKKPTDSEYREWQTENARLIPLAKEVDVMFPSLYTFYDDRDAWVSSAKAKLNEAHHYGKPVYAFLWPQYHNSNRLIGSHFIAPDFWKLELETAAKYADGIVIWGGWGENGPMEWDESASWWKVTREFINKTRKP